MPYYGEENQNGQYWDGKTFVSNPKSQSEFNKLFLRNLTIGKEYDDNNCHLDGCFKCSRCRRRHYIIGNYDLLCDGCMLSELRNGYTKTIENITKWNTMSKRYWSGEFIPEIAIRKVARDMLDARLDT